MSEIWQIIGLSSLIASIINIIGNVISNIYVAKRSFQRESEAGYIQSQIQLYSKIYFLILRVRVGAAGDFFFQNFITEIKEINEIIKNSSFLLKTNILMKWIDLGKLLVRITRDTKGEDMRDRIDQYYDTLWPKFDELATLISEFVNDDLNPRYKEIVGKTVPNLAAVEVHRKRDLDNPEV